MQKLLFVLTLSVGFFHLSMGQNFINEFTNSGLSAGVTRSEINQVIDYDNDGYEDLIYLYDSLNVIYKCLYRNNGNGQFSKVSAFNIGGKLEFLYSAGSAGWMKIFDFNVDGYMDIVCQQADTLRFFQNKNGNGEFEDKAVCFGFNGISVPKNQFAMVENSLEPIFLSDIDEDDDVDIVFGRINSNGTKSIWMFENRLATDNSFNNLVEIIPNISTTSTTPVVAFDYNNDSRDDILTIMYSGSAYVSHQLRLFRNDGNLNFTEVTGTANMGSSSWWGFANVVDLNNDGNFDLAIGSTDANQPNRLLVNNGNGTFTNNATAIENGVGNYYYPKSVVIDYDNDMDLDLHWEGSGFGFPGSPLLTNNGSLSFTENASIFGLKTFETVGNQNGTGLINWLDYNNDGKLDQFRSRGNSAAPQLKRNTINNGNNYLKLKLKECSHNLNAIGSRVQVVAGNNEMWLCNYGAAMQSQGQANSSIFHFGLNSSQVVDSINVFWSNGNITTLTNVNPNQLLTIEEVPNCQMAFSLVSISTFNDINQNCLFESSELAISDINVSLSPGNYIGTTNADGQVAFPYIPDGTYTATIDTTNLNWSASCPVTQTFTVQNGVADCIGFGLVNDNPCTDPDVSIYAPFLRRCLSNQKVYVSACNQNTATGVLNASYVDVELDPLMTVTSSTLPYTPQGNNIYRFETGNINPGQCVNFNISTTISCNANLGQTLCMDANLYPVESCVLDSVPSNPPTNTGGGGTLGGLPQPCTLPWDQSSLSVDGWCQNDTIYFTITNTGDPGGGDMECHSPLWVTVDGVTTFTDSIMIPGGQTITYTFPGDGATWILNASQHPLHPGNSQPNAHVESCGDSTNFTPGQVNEQPLNDADPVVDIYCGTVTGSYDPNDKTGYPLGLTDQRYIQPNQQLQYVIRFQNTGTDTAFTVVIRDTLDTDLNIFTVTPGVSSHPYTFKMYGPRVLEWTFENINLPDSTTDQAGSNGFATFHVEQVPNLVPGTEINNDADIYFDFNDPITTNTTVHRIYEGFVSVLNLEELNATEGQLLVYPNPTTGAITIHSTKAMNQGYTIHDQMGRTVVTGKLNGYDTNVSLSHLAKGMYILKVNGNYKPAQLVKE